MSEDLIANLSRIIARLPGLGPRIARRIILRLANNKDKVLTPLIDALSKFRAEIASCEICGNLDEGTVCKICQDHRRDGSVICVVEEVVDLWAVERTQNYRGKYHILGGNLSAFHGKTVADLNLDSLYTRIRNDEINEVIIATSATVDGQTTAYFLAENLKTMGVKITRLAYGMPVGSEFDYLDDGTIDIALKSRKEF